MSTSKGAGFLTVGSASSKFVGSSNGLFALCLIGAKIVSDTNAIH